jgi:hypothetical protein
MKASKSGETTLTGKVVQKTFGENSKSEHNAVYLQTSEDIYQLRRLGGNSFSDPVLNKLVGKNITATGILTGMLFLAKDIKEG